MTIAKIPYFTIESTGTKVPAIGFGSGTAWRIQKWKQHDENKVHELIEPLVEQVKTAIDVGFRHIDTAEAYFTYREVGEGIRASGIDRNELFITDKWSPGVFKMTGSKGPYESLSRALGAMKIDYIDLYLLHSPQTNEGEISTEDAWLQLESLCKEGKVKNIGVSNFSVDWLEKIAKVGTITPAVNQIEFHAYLQEQTPGIVGYAKAHDILLEAYSPLAPIMRARPGPLDTLLPSLVEKYGKSETLILLRWVYQNGIIPLTTSSKAERLTDALSIFNFQLDDEDVKKIAEVGKQKHFQGFKFF
jgi:diketogulonate reductase-like aldo/keto reductase